MSKEDEQSKAKVVFDYSNTSFLVMALLTMLIAAFPDHTECLN